MQPLIPRQHDILEIARRDGRVNVERLAECFDVTPQTIRKDLNDLCGLNKLQRVHGGAVFPSDTVNLAYQSRRRIASAGKEQIGLAVAERIPDGASLIINIGTTTEQVAQALSRHERLMVITNNLNVANILSSAPGIELMLAGGTLRKADGGIIGEAAVDLIRQFKVDYAIVGASAIDEEGALLDYDYREVRVTQAILGHARQKILVADATKFERRAPVQIGHLADTDTFVTDRRPPNEIVAMCDSSEVELVVAESASLPHEQEVA